jgi:hypothetical protein
MLSAFAAALAVAAVSAGAAKNIQISGQGVFDGVGACTDAKPRPQQGRRWMLFRVRKFSKLKATLSLSGTP